MISERVDSILTRILNADKYAYGDLFAACDELYNELIHLSGLNTDEECNRQNLTLDSGSALGVAWAAMCIKDFMRTKRFMDGVFNATQQKIKNAGDRPVQVLYAGTGPFATLVLPLMARFTEQQVQFILLEVNEASMTNLKKLVRQLDLEKYIMAMELADATKWKLPTDFQIDIFICETMLQGLKNEPQVAICHNILPQLPAEAIMIPQQITLRATLANQNKIMSVKMEGGNIYDGIITLDPVFTLNRNTILENLQKNFRNHNDLYFPETTISIPGKMVETHPCLSILTDIIIYNDEQLQLEESALTLLLTLTIVQPSVTAIKFQYVAGKNPGLIYKLLSASSS